MKVPLLTMAAGAMLTGCGLVPQSVSGYGAAPIGTETVRPYQDLIGVLSSTTPPLVTPACLSLAGADTTGTCRAERDNAVAALMVASESACLLHRKSIYGNEAGYNIALGTATSLFAGAASVVKQVQDKAVLAALATFTNSERSLINETVYKTMIVTAVDKKIQEVRDVQAQAIYGRLQSMDANRYRVQQALFDWSQFHSACSFMTGLQKALDEGIQGGNAQKMLRLRANLRQLDTDVARAECAAASASPAAPAASTPPSGTTPPAPAASAASAPASDCASLRSRQKKLNDELMALETQ